MAGLSSGFGWRFAQWVIALAAAALLWLGCGTHWDSPEEETGSSALAVITGTGPCRTSTLTSTATPTTITNGSEPTISPTISAMFPQELKVLSGDATAFTALLGTSTTVSGTTSLINCTYTAAGSQRMLRQSCVGTAFDAILAFDKLSLSLTRNVAGTGSLALQASVSALEDNKRCTADSCDPSTGVSHANLPEGTACSADNNVCNGVDSCNATGACVAGPNAPAGTPCSDGNPCNGTELCSGSGTCSPGAAPPAGTSCSDGNFCNGQEYCGSGVCQPGAVPPASAFDDKDPCTTDGCDPARGGIVNDLIPACTSNAGAPPLDTTAPASLGDSAQFLYSGGSPVQTGVTSGTIDTARTGVVRGRVLGAAAGVTPAPVVGAVVTVVGHPELGQTLTRAGGWYDLAVNGGSFYTVDVNTTGYLRVQRQARPPALGYFIVDDIVLTPPYLSLDKFVPGAPTGKAVKGLLTPAARDLDGARQAVVYFPPGTRTTNYTVADGTPLDVQVTEYTVGTGAVGGGPQRMPGDLPGTSGYTYAVGVSLPSATAAGVQDVQFDKDVVILVTNFTGYPVGQSVPLGYYDRTKGAWMAERTGRIIKIVTAPAGGEATVDIDSSAGAETPAVLDAFGINAAERMMLAVNFAAGATLWRVAVQHFSDWDANWAYGPPPNAPTPPGPDPQDDDPDDPCERSGSIIGCESRTLGEMLPIVGTPLSLHYQSERAQGFRNRLRIRITDGVALAPAPLKAHIEIEVAGRMYHYERPAPLALNDSLTWTWDGTDAYGRTIEQGAVDARIRVGFEYGGSPTFSTNAFAESAANGVQIAGNRTARTVTLWKESHQLLRRSQARALGFGGWTLDAHHLLVGEDTIYFGNGRRRKVSTGDQLPLNYIVDKFAGGGAPLAYGDGGPANQAWVGQSNDVAAAGDGSVYLAHDGAFSNGRLRRVAPDGIITTIAGLPPVAPRAAGSDGSPALNAQVFAQSIALLPDGALVFAEPSTNQIWKIDAGPAPKLRRIAGTGAAPTTGDCNAGACGDGGPATSAILFNPTSVVAGADGTIFVADRNHNRVRRIGPEGTITTYYTNPIAAPEAIAIRADGVLFATLGGGNLARIEVNGTATLVKEPTGTPSILNTGWCGQSSAFFGAVAPLPDDSILVTCYSQVFARSPQGILSRIAGPALNATAGYAGDGGPAIRALFQGLGPISLGPKGDIFVADTVNGNRVRRLHAPSVFQGVGVIDVPSQDGSEIYEFSPAGRHLRTRTTLRGATRYAFGYDPSTGQLTSVTDEASNVTQITRTASAVTITSPYGQVTKLNLDASDYVASVQNPIVSEITQVAHTGAGLLTDLVDPKGHAHHFEYGVDGRLTKDVDATPGSLGTRLVATSTSTSYSVEITSAEGRVTRHEVNLNQSFGDRAIIERRRITNAAGLTTVSDKSVDDSVAVTRPDGTATTVLETAADPRWGGLATYSKKLVTQVGTHALTRDESRTATLATAGDPFSVTGQTIAATLSGAGVTSATTTRTFAAGPPTTWTTTSGAGRQTRETLDSLDRITMTEVLGASPVTLEPVQYQYDTRGRVDQVTWGTRVYGTTYNAATGWVDSTTAPAALGATYNSRDLHGRPMVTTLPGSRTLATSYDLAGNLVSVTPPTQPAHLFGFDPNDRLASYAPPDLVPALSPKDTLYTRDLDGLLLLANHPGKPVTYAYDLLGRLTRRVDAVTTTQSYDAAGRLATIGTSDGVLLTNTYDGSLMTQQALSGPFSHAVNKTFDNFLRVSSWNVDGTGPIALTYDGDNLITVAGPMTVTRSPNGLLTGTALGVVPETFGYNTYGEVASHGVTGSATAFSVTTTRDVAGRIDVRTEAIGGVTHAYRYGYDAAGRLAAVYVDGATVATRAWTYDGNGNRDGATYDDQDRLTAFGSATYAYGNNGELATKTVAGATTSYTYDANGNLRGLTRPAPLTALTYLIDGQSRRVGKKAGGALVQGFVYDGARVVAELGSTGAEVARFVYATGTHSPDFMVKAGVTYRIVKDHLGSPRLVVNAANGALAQRLDYDEWGVVTLDSSPGFQPFGFAGGIYDRDTSLVRFGARDYDPSLGRWTSKDTWRFGGKDTNFYAYVTNDPVNWIDPTGHEGSEYRGGGGGSGGGGSSDSYDAPSGPPPSDPGPKPPSPCPEDPPSTEGSCSCQHRDIFESGGKSCQTLREEGTCGGPYKGNGDDSASCQKNARDNAPAACRGCLGHCKFTK